MPKSKTSLEELLHEIRRIEEHREVLTEKKIRKIYKQLMKELNNFLGETYTKYANDNGGLTVVDLEKTARMANFIEEIEKSCNNLLPEVSKEINDTIDKVREKCYVGMVEAVENSYDLTGLSVRPEVMTATIENNIDKLGLPPLLERDRKNVIYGIKQVLSIGLMNGLRYEQMARQINEKLDTGYKKAITTVRTESHRNIEGGFMECAERLSAGLEGSGYIYCCTWRTMGDERVRPQRRYKTKKGWKSSYNKNGANHVKMEGVTVKVGELFNLGGGVKAKCPSHSGVAAHDCNCRCFLEYNLLTPEEYKKATGKNIAIQAMPKDMRQAMTDNGIVDLELRRTTNESQFDIAIKNAKNANANGACVDTHPKGELETFKLFLSDDNMAGVAVKPDGDITAVFKNSNSQAKGAVNDLIITARQNGGDKMDCYGKFLVNSYEKCGYVPVARIPFNADYVDDPFLLKTQPDVYAMMKNTDDISTVIKKNSTKAYKLSSQTDLDDLPTFTDYDEALKYRDELLAEQTKGEVIN